MFSLSMNDGIKGFHLSGGCLKSLLNFKNRFRCQRGSSGAAQTIKAHRYLQILIFAVACVLLGPQIANAQNCNSIIEESDYLGGTLPWDANIHNMHFVGVPLGCPAPVITTVQVSGNPSLISAGSPSLNDSYGGCGAIYGVDCWFFPMNFNPSTDSRGASANVVIVEGTPVGSGSVDSIGDPLTITWTRKTELHI